MMNCEEYLTYFDAMRGERDTFKELNVTVANLAEERKNKIDQIVANYKKQEKNRLEGKKDTGTQTTFSGSTGRNAKDQMGSSRGSGSI